MSIKERCRSFVSEIGLPVRSLCRHIGISDTAYYRWLKDDLRLSRETEQRIDLFLQKYNF